MASCPHDPLVDCSQLTDDVRGLRSQLESLRETFEHAVREFQNDVDHLASSKAPAKQIDQLLDRHLQLDHRTTMLESRVNQLANRCMTIEHTAFKVDPDSVMPLLHPLSNRIETLEYDLALRNDDQVRACGAQAADEQSSLDMLRARIAAME